MFPGTLGYQLSYFLTTALPYSFSMLTFPLPVIKHRFPLRVSPLSSRMHLANSTTPYPVAYGMKHGRQRVEHISQSLAIMFDVIPLALTRGAAMGDSRFTKNQFVCFTKSYWSSASSLNPQVTSGLDRCEPHMVAHNQTDVLRDWV